MEQHYVNALKTDNNSVIKELYNTNRSAFLGFAKKYTIDETDAIDIYQEAFLAIRKHALTGQLYQVSCSFKTYLFGISKNLFYEKIKDYSLKTNFDSNRHKIDDDYDEIILEPEKELTEEQHMLQYHFQQLGKRCQQMLTLSFYRGLTNEEIATLEGYESEAVVRSQKSRCLKTLKELINKSPRK